MCDMDLGTADWRGSAFLWYTLRGAECERVVKMYWRDGLARCKSYLGEWYPLQEGTLAITNKYAEREIIGISIWLQCPPGRRIKNQVDS